LLRRRETNESGPCFWSSGLREQKMYQCSYVYSISQCGICAAWVCVWRLPLSTDVRGVEALHQFVIDEFIVDAVTNFLLISRDTVDPDLPSLYYIAGLARLLRRVQ
jgi:hypothetical protein